MLARIPITARRGDADPHVVAGSGPRLRRRRPGRRRVVTVGAALGAPLLGRLVDRRGLRPVVVLTTVAEVIFWATAPTLAVLAAAASPRSWPGCWRCRSSRSSGSRSPRWCRRRTDARAYALDSMSIELSFMIGPALAVAAGHQRLRPGHHAARSAPASSLAGIALWLLNPPIRGAEEPPARGARVPRRQLADPPAARRARGQRRRHAGARRHRRGGGRRAAGGRRGRLDRRGARRLGGRLADRRLRVRRGAAAPFSPLAAGRPARPAAPSRSGWAAATGGCSALPLLPGRRALRPHHRRHRRRGQPARSRRRRGEAMGLHGSASRSASRSALAAGRRGDRRLVAALGLRGHRGGRRCWSPSWSPAGLRSAARRPAAPAMPRRTGTDRVATTAHAAVGQRG